MSALELEPEAPAVDGLTARVLAVMAELAAAIHDPAPVDDRTRIDRIAALEKLPAVSEALQQAEIVRFGQAQVEAQLAHDVHPRQIGAGIADQLGLACRVSAFQGARRLAIARALWFDLPQTYAALARGELSQRVAAIIVEETRHLDQTTRQQVDAQVIAAGIADLGVRAAGNCARKHAYEADRQGYVDRGKAARTQRRVTLRPGADSMCFLTGQLPLEQGVSCWAALNRAADAGKAAGDERSRSQIMADTLGERLTGQTRAEDVNVDVDVQIVLPAELVSDPDSPRSATVPGHGPLPGPIAREIIDRSRGIKHWRTAGLTSGNQVVSIGERRRRFTGSLADLVRLRDQACRMPFCDAPIRHLDHIEEFRHGGRTTLANGQGLCEHHNYLRNVPGWQTTPIHTGLAGRPHETVITTPTGHSYRSRAPDPP